MSVAMLGLTHHARQQMRRRSISASEVEEALAAVETIYPSDHDPDGRFVVLGVTATSRRLKIVVSAREPQVVITVADRDDER